MPDALSFDDATLELVVLGDIYRGLQQGRDRQPDDILAADVDWSSGLIINPAGLKPPSRQLRGEALVRKAHLSPATIAGAHILDDQGVALCRKPPAQWTDLESETHARMVEQLDNLLRRWEAAGLCRREPPVGFYDDRDRERADPDDAAWGARITTKGIEEARRRIPGTEYARGPTSLLWSMSAEQRRAAPQWAQKEFQDEGGHL